MNERDIQRCIWQDKWQSMSLMVPNYTPHRWFECDMFAVTKAGYFYEYEIKLTKADLRADLRKRSRPTYRRRENGQRGYERRPGELKHERLVRGDECGPSLFFYVVPKDMVSVNEIPAWAGLAYVELAVVRRGMIEIVKRPPRRHQTKVAKKVVDHARGVCYHRYWQERQKVDRLKAVRGAA